MSSPPPEIYRLLLIDDDEDEFVITRDIVAESRVLASLDWADDYAVGEKLALQEEHDCYLIDYYLGARTGVELLRSLRAKGCRVPIIILTGRAGDEIDMEALDAGATDYLEKRMLNTPLLERVVRYAVHQQANKNRLEDLVQQVTQLEKLKTDMIRIAAHDLRSPLTVMTGYVEMARGDLQDGNDEGVESYLTQMKEAVRHMQKMVQDILSLERISELSGGHTEPVAFVDIVQESYQRHQTADHTFDLALPAAPITVYGIGPLLREAVDNLITNAVKYTPEGGRIGVEISADADSVLFRVSDNGYGIPEKLQKNLFNPFYRAKTKETRKIGGTGLGLHLVKNIVERHNGSIYFESEYGKGSTFGFMLPQIPEDTL